jgi:hypothetical protein
MANGEKLASVKTAPNAPIADRLLSELRRDPGRVNSECLTFGSVRFSLVSAITVTVAEDSQISFRSRSN